MNGPPRLTPDYRVPSARGIPLRDLPVCLAERDALLPDEPVGFLGRVDPFVEPDATGNERDAVEHVRQYVDAVGGEIYAAKQRALQALQVAVIARRELGRDHQ